MDGTGADRGERKAAVAQKAAARFVVIVHGLAPV
jgi:hypothetical protein